MVMMVDNQNDLFIDTNILVYASVPESPFHTQATTALNQAYQNKRTLWISRQIIREFLAAMTKQSVLKVLPNPALVVEAITAFQEQFNIADDTQNTTTRLYQLFKNHQVYGRQVHDANIVATMQTHHISCLLTHNISDFKRFNDLITLEDI